MDLTKITLAQISAFIVAVGVLSGLFGKFFSQIYKIKQLEERMKTFKLKLCSFCNSIKKSQRHIFKFNVSTRIYN